MDSCLLIVKTTAVYSFGLRLHNLVLRLTLSSVLYETTDQGLSFSAMLNGSYGIKRRHHA